MVKFGHTLKGYLAFQQHVKRGLAKHVETMLSTFILLSVRSNDMLCNNRELGNGSQQFISFGFTRTTDDYRSINDKTDKSTAALVRHISLYSQKEVQVNEILSYVTEWNREWGRRKTLDLNSS